MEPDKQGDNRMRYDQRDINRGQTKRDFWAKVVSLDFSY
jgi:hypothetical protein